MKSDQNKNKTKQTKQQALPFKRQVKEEPETGFRFNFNDESDDSEVQFLEVKFKPQTPDKVPRWEFPSEEEQTQTNYPQITYDQSDENEQPIYQEQEDKQGPDGY